MALNRGKQFEEKVRLGLEALEGSTVERFVDQQSGYKGSTNTSDFLMYLFPYAYYIECKTTMSNTYSIASLSQYDKLLSKRGRKGVRAGVVLWYVNRDKVVYIPISTFEKAKKDGLKSINIKMLEDDTYRIIEIPSKKLRVFMDSDFSILTQLEEGD